jgi:hypothetical protein
MMPSYFALREYDGIGHSIGELFFNVIMLALDKPGYHDSLESYLSYCFALA